MRFSAIFSTFSAWHETNDTDNDAKSKKYFFDKSNFVRPFYLIIWVGPDCTFKNVNWQPALV